VTAQQRTLIFYGAIVVAIVLAIVGVLYLAGDMFYPTGRHVKHAILAFVLAVGALIIANFNRPSVQARI
jgi:hypothetical protein